MHARATQLSLDARRAENKNLLASNFAFIDVNSFQAND